MQNGRFPCKIALCLKKVKFPFSLLLDNAAVLKASKSDKPAYLNVSLNYYTPATKDLPGSTDQQLTTSQHKGFPPTDIFKRHQKIHL